MPISGDQIAQTTQLKNWQANSFHEYTRQLSSNLPVQNFFLEKNRGDDTSLRDLTSFKYPDE